MDLSEFDALAEPLRRRSAASETEYGFALIEGRTATADDVAAVERRLGVILPERYKAFMTRYGGGAFGFVDLFPVDELVTVDDFVAVAPVGTGDHWGFPVTDGRCHEQVWFHFHDAGEHEPVAKDFLAFVADRGLTPR